ncbi:MAG: tetratricopeptide repeat protein, partial [Flavobacterium sp.]|nr:tetratricopeptide repeat protein [Flavobacterium sp.]
MKNNIFLLIAMLQFSFQKEDCSMIHVKLKESYSLAGIKKAQKLDEIKSMYQTCNLSIDSIYVSVINTLLELHIEDENQAKSYDIVKILRVTTVNSSIDNALKIKAFRNISRFFNFISDYKNEISTYEYILDNFKNDKSAVEQIAQTYQNLSSAFFQKGDYEQAVIIANKGVEYSKNAELFSLMVQNTLMKIKSLNSLGRTNEAVQVFESTLNTLKGKPDKTLLISVYRNKGYLMRNLGKSKEAIDAFEKVKKIKESLKQPTALYDLDIGFVYYDLEKNYEKALYHYHLALTHTEDDYLKLRLLDNIGAVYWKKKDYIKAIETYQRGFTEFRDINFKTKDIHSNPQANAFKNLDLKDFFLTLAQDKAICWLDYAKSENYKKEYLQYALQTYELADNLIDFMRHEHTGTQSKFFWRNKTRPIYESAIETCYLLKDYQKAFYFFEKSRSVLLNDKLNELGAKQKLSDVDLQKEKDFLRQISELNTSIENEKNAKINAELNNKLLDLQEQQDRFIKSLETKNPAYYQLKYDTKIADLKAVQNYLNEIGGGSLVEYFVGDSATYAIVVSPTSVAIKKLDYDKNIAQKFLNKCSKNLATKTELNEFNKLSYQVFQNLVEPLNLPKGRVIISQDGVFLPFEALSKAANKAEFIVNDYMISYTYSAQFLLKNREKKGFLPNRTFIGFAPVNFTQKL